MIQKVKLSAIKPSENNPRMIRDHKFKALVKSVKDFPEMLQYRPIIVDKDGIILGGNMRYLACKEAGLKEVSVIYANELTEEQQREFMIKDNVNFGEWNWDDLANEWDTELLVNWGIDSFNFGTSADLLDFSSDESEEDDTEGQGSGESSTEQHKITDDGYVRFELIMLEEQKIAVIDTLNEIKEAQLCSLGEALFILSELYKNDK